MRPPCAPLVSGKPFDILSPLSRHTEGAVEEVKVSTAVDFLQSSGFPADPQASTEATPLTTHC